MLPDSTSNVMGKEEIGKKKSKKQKKKITNTKAKKKSTKKGSKKKKIIKEHDSDLDLDKEMKPIGNFIKDPEEMVYHMFHSIRGVKLNATIPDILKKLPEEELKALCVEHLDIMSKKRIRRILAGDDPASISSSGTEDESSEEGNQTTNCDINGGAGNDIKHTQAADSTSQTADQKNAEKQNETEKSSQLSIDIEEGENISDVDEIDNDSEGDPDRDMEHFGEDDDEMMEEIIEQDSNVSDEYVGSEEGEIEDMDEVGNGDDDSQNADGLETDNDDQNETDEHENPDLEELLTDIQETAKQGTPIGLSKNQLEIFELEMRARAIKSMLDANDSQ